ncbi:class II Aldolase and Adducin domain protein [Dictyocaulus viviparus]|uniref:Class II Aldolase and Adducin domain protein n=1 Tax=Dictyocaulus viviparus TaxID=29172 RepID=A0A0D8Y383_DICVI|nr:class II Aldolase and Adducin domain protein [Dictyocaulus viviparus]
MHLRHIYKLVLQLAALQRVALSMVCHECEAAISVFEEYRTTIFTFICQQVNPSLRGYEKLFLLSFLTSCIQDAAKLFGDSTDLVAWKYEAVERAYQLTEIEKAQEESFLTAIQSMSLDKRPNQLAHSGMIGKGARHLQKVELPTEDAFHRAHVFLDAMRTTCLSHTRESNFEACKLVVSFRRNIGLESYKAEVITEALCHDALGGDFLFYDWDVEKEFVSKYLEISKRLNSSWISQGLMEVVAENPPCLWFMLPVIKAELATIMAKFENVVDKSRVPTEEMLSRFDNWLFIVRKGDILSERFELTMDIIPHVTCYEGFLLLVEIWRHFQRRGASYNSIHAVYNAVLKGEEARLHITMDGSAEIYRLVVQKNIGDLGHLFPLLARLPGERTEILINPFGLLYHEQTASTLVKVDLEGNVLNPGSTNLGINQAAYTLHSAIHGARSDIQCVIHLHTPVVAAVSATKCGILPVCQESMIIGPVAYHDYQGILVNLEERESLVRDMGSHNVMILRNHGFVVAGRTIEEAFHFTYHLILACETQAIAMRCSDVDGLILPTEEVVRRTFKTASQGGGGVNRKNGVIDKQWKVGELEWLAWMRTLDEMGLQTGCDYRSM